MRKIISEKNASPLYKHFEDLKKRHEGNLFLIALTMSDLYVDNYDMSRDHIYIKSLKKHYLFLELIGHLVNDNTRGKCFPFDKKLIKIGGEIDKIKKVIYDKWSRNLLSFTDFWLNHATEELRDNFQHLVYEFSPYNIDDMDKLKRKLRII